MYAEVPQVELMAEQLEQELAEDLFDIPSDAYGAAILALVRDFPALWVPSRAQVAAYNCLFGFGLLSLNICMQFALLGYVNEFVVNFDVYHVQEQFRGLRETVYRDDKFQIELWNDYEPLQKQFFCSVGMTNSVFYYCCIFCWTLTVMIECRTNIDFASDVWRMPKCYNSLDQILVTVNEGHTSESIVGLTTCTRMTLYLIVVIPKFAISAYLLWLGCNWLSAAKSFESLVMNCVAMAFVVGTDEMLFCAILPKSFREEVEGLDFLIKEPPKDEQTLKVEKLSGYNTSIAFLLMACVFVYSYTFYMQEVLPIEVLAMEPVCKAYLASKYSGICDAWGLAMAGKDTLEECYPIPSLTESTLT